MWRHVSFLCCLVFLAGCGRVSRTSECRELAKTVNETLDQVESKLDGAANDPAVLRDIAARYQKLAGEVEARVKGDDGKARTLREYASLFRDTSRVLSQLAVAIEKKDIAAAVKARRDLAILGRRDKPVVLRIEANCMD
jgi:hypothetical protein